MLAQLAEKEIGDISFYELDKAGMVLKNFIKAASLSNELLESAKKAKLIKNTLSDLASHIDVFSEKNISGVAESLKNVRELTETIAKLTAELTRIQESQEENWSKVKDVDGIENIIKQREVKAKLSDELVSKIQFLKSQIEFNETSVVALLTTLPENINKQAVVKMLAEKSSQFDNLDQLIENKYRELFQIEPDLARNIDLGNLEGSIRERINQKVAHLLKPIFDSNKGGVSDNKLRNELINNGGMVLDINVVTQGESFREGRKIRTGDGSRGSDMYLTQPDRLANENYYKIKKDLGINLPLEREHHDGQDFSPQWWASAWIPLDTKQMDNVDLELFTSALGCFKYEKKFQGYQNAHYWDNEMGVLVRATTNIRLGLTKKNQKDLGSSK